MAATIKIPTTFTAEDKFTGVLKRMTSGVKGFSRKSVAAVERFDNKISRTFSKMDRLSQIGLGLGVAGLFTLAGQGNLQYEKSLASVSAITGATGKDLVDLEKKSMDTAKSTYKSGSDILKAYELIGSAKPELLQNSEALDRVTRSAITLSKASGMELEQSALSLTDVMNQFNLTAEDSTKVIDVLAAGAKYGAAAIPLIQQSILGFGTTAKSANVNLQESVALVETFASKGIKGAEAGTKLRNVLTKMTAVDALPPEALKQLDKFGVNTDIVSDKTLPFIDRLKELSKIAKDDTALVKVFGLENKDAAQILLQNLPMYDSLVGKLDETGTAYEQAAKNSSTLAYWIKGVKDSFINATTATQSNNKALEVAKSSLKLVADNMETVVGVIMSLVVGYGIMKAIVIGSKVAMVAYNVVLGIQAGLQGTLTKSVALSSVQLGAYKVAQMATATWGYAVAGATSVWTGSQWLLNAALTANPIGLIIAGVAALIGVVALIINKYDTWGAAATMLLGPLGMIINVVMNIKKHWDSIVSAFKEDGIMAGIKKIGAVIFDSMLIPIQQFLGLISKIPGVGDMIAPAMKFIDGMRSKMEMEINGNPPEVISSPEERNGKLIQENYTKGRLDVNFNDPDKKVKDVKQSGNFAFPLVTSTQGQS